MISCFLSEGQKGSSKIETLKKDLYASDLAFLFVGQINEAGVPLHAKVMHLAYNGSRPSHSVEAYW